MHDMAIAKVLKRKRSPDHLESPRLLEQSTVKRMRLQVNNEQQASPTVQEEVTVNALRQPIPITHASVVDRDDDLASTPTIVKAEDIIPSSPPHIATTPAKVMNPAKLTKARETIEAQLNLEILLKHNELRLIEQELAKVQISLEQLRRCHIIPFPGTPGSAATVDQISDGTGPAINPQPGYTRPTYPAPWGIKEGPYSQHYARWLIPDAAFDSSQSTPARARHSTGSKSLGTSDARGQRAVERDHAGANRRQRQSTGSKASANLNGNGNGQPKEKPSGPLKLKRNDGTWVKLVCRHCGKEDVNSVQGFLNHCRIAHGDTMRAHQEAAAAHGIPLDEDEVVATPTTLTKPTLLSATSTGGSAQPQTNVHPFNTAGRKLQAYSQSSFSTPTRPSPLHSSFGEADDQISVSPAPITTSASFSPTASSWPNRPKEVSPKPLANDRYSAPQHMQVDARTMDPNFVASPHTPSLSALAQKLGYGIDLAKLVTSARQKADLDQVESLVPDSDDDCDDANVAQGTAPKNLPTSTQSGASHPASSSSAVTGQTTGTRMPLNAPPAQPPTQAAPPNPRHPIIIPNSASSSFDPIVASPISITQPGLHTPSPASAAPSTGDNSHINELSPRTAKSNPGMVTDREDDDDDYEEIADSEIDVEEASALQSGSQHSVRIRGDGDDDVTMREVDEAERAGDAKMVSSSQEHDHGHPEQRHAVKAGFVEKKAQQQQAQTKKRGRSFKRQG